MPLSSRTLISPHLIRLVSLFALAALLLLPEAGAASKFKTLYSFKGGTDGVYPTGALVFDAAGNLYGTTFSGGGGPCSGGNDNGCGIVFELIPGSGGGWKESVLHRFAIGNNSSDGTGPNGSMIFDAAGNLYGSTLTGGGADNQCSSGAGLGCGTVFKLMPHAGGKWAEDVLYRFELGNDGAGPEGSVMLDSAGNVYGTATAGGNCCDAPVFGWGAGVTFELTPGSGGWTENLLYSFCSENKCSDGDAPEAGLIQGRDGSLYGTTAYGGSNAFPCSGLGCGVVFKLTKNSGGTRTESVLHEFSGGSGANPSAGLIFDSKGNLYGTTSTDGAFGYGTVFQLIPTSSGPWKYSVLYSFRTGSYYGSFSTKVVFDSAGNLYGTIWTAGSGNCEGVSCGLVYKLTPGSNGRWKYSTLHKFSGGQDGGFPNGDLILDGKGNLYGTASVGGAQGNGVVFALTP
jgi:uncharacterized repeat protein (TIGR03803 family)